MYFCTLVAATQPGHGAALFLIIRTTLGIDIDRDRVIEHGTLFYETKAKHTTKKDHLVADNWLSRPPSSCVHLEDLAHSGHQPRREL